MKDREQQMQRLRGKSILGVTKETQCKDGLEGYEKSNVLGDEIRGKTTESLPFQSYENCRFQTLRGEASRRVVNRGTDV